MTATYQTIYLDYQATTPLDFAVFTAMEQFLKKDYGNPHSTDHILGWTARKAVENGRAQIADLIGSDPEEIIFTSGATESNNLALQGLATVPPEGRKRILVSSIEHKSILATVRHLERCGYVIEHIPVDSSGLIDLEYVDARLSEDVLLVSVMAVNNEIGTIEPIFEVAQRVHAVGARFHTDAAQAPLAMDFDVSDAAIDMLSLSGHKIYGPKGIGALFVRRSIMSSLKPIIHGGGQEEGLRSGTLPTPQCVGFGAAAALVKNNGRNERERLSRLRDQFFSLLKSKYPRVLLNGPTLEDRHPGNLNVCFPGINAHHLLSAVQPHLAASTGSACTSGQPQVSHVLKGIGLNDEAAACSVRFSLGRFSSEEEVARAVTIITDALTRAEELY